VAAIKIMSQFFSYNDAEQYSKLRNIIKMVIIGWNILLFGNI